jgi:peptidoglycan/LPS O-acetylase OafA/YrhL
MPQTPTSSKAWPKPDKLIGLEGLRFLATVAVLLWHYQHFAFVADHPVGLVRSDLPFYEVLFPFYEAGEYGVWVFWCISGFIFFWKYRAIIAERSIDGWTFFVYRLSRLYPLHLATLLLVALLQPLYRASHGFFFIYQNNDAIHFVAQLFMASDWLPPRSSSFNGPIWSVSVEVLVYAVFYLALRFVTTSPLLNIVVILAALTVGAQVTTCLVFFYAGGLVAIARRAVSDTRHPRLVEMIAACASAILPIALWLSVSDHAAFAGRLLLVTMPFLLFCSSGRLVLPHRIERLLETLGNMTYSCYLLHFPIQLAFALGYSLAEQPIPYQNHLFWAGFILLTLAASHFTYRYFEAPSQQLISAILQRNRASGTSRSAPLRYDGLGPHDACATARSASCQFSDTKSASGTG